MGLISKLLGNDEPKSTRSLKPAAPAGDIGYDPGLVEKLKADHQKLVQIYTAIKTATAEHRYGQLHDLLAEFKLEFQLHIATENVKFYVYLQQHASQDVETTTFIAEVRREMNDIARAVLKFADTYMSAPPTPSTVTEFTGELDQIGAVLIKRVDKEENKLYLLYQP